MSEQPWFKFYAADYLLDPDVDSIPREAESLLVRMWCICHREGSCPVDVETLARKTQCSQQYVSQFKPQCEPFFELRDGKLYSRRMEDEKQRSEQARKNANSRYAKSKPKSKSKAVSESESESERGSADCTATRTAIGSAVCTAKTSPAEWIPAEAWAGFIEMRRRTRKSPTDRAIKLIVAELAKLRDRGEDPGEILDQSTRNGWQDVFPIKGGVNGRKPSATTTS
jgi:uncharacterized protein YdaU (DUF1376 family)